MTCVGGLNFLTTWCLFPWEGAERQSPAGRLFYNLASAARSGIDTAFPALSRPASSSGRGNRVQFLMGHLNVLEEPRCTNTSSALLGKQSIPRLLSEATHPPHSLCSLPPPELDTTQTLSVVILQHLFLQHREMLLFYI